MPIAVPTRGTARAELCNNHRDAILLTLKYAGKRLTLSDIADAINTTLSETAQALELLRRLRLVEGQSTPFKPATFALVGRVGL